MASGLIGIAGCMSESDDLLRLQASDNQSLISLAVPESQPFEDDTWSESALHNQVNTDMGNKACIRSAI